MMQFPKCPPDLVATFDRVIPGPPVQRKLMFGYPAAFVNGNMFMCLFGDALIVRLSEDGREKLIASGGHMFEPMEGRPMREYVAIPGAMLGDTRKLNAWIARSRAFAESLPPKKQKSTKRGAKKRPR